MGDQTPLQEIHFHLGSDEPFSQRFRTKVKTYGLKVVQDMRMSTGKTGTSNPKFFTVYESVQPVCLILYESYV